LVAENASPLSSRPARAVTQLDALGCGIDLSIPPVMTAATAGLALILRAGHAFQQPPAGTSSGRPKI
jgi:hypothetical protein